MATARKIRTDGVPVQFYVTEETHEVLLREAAASGTSISGYLRSKIPSTYEANEAHLRDADQGLLASKAQVTEALMMFAGIRRDLKRIGNNLNQSVKVLNSHALYSNQLPTQLDVRDDLNRLDEAIRLLSREIWAIKEEASKKA